MSCALIPAGFGLVRRNRSRMTQGKFAAVESHLFWMCVCVWGVSVSALIESLQRNNTHSLNSTQVANEHPNYLVEVAAHLCLMRV